MSSVENAITMALKKDGVELPTPKIAKPMETESRENDEHRSGKSSSHSKSKKRKRRAKEKERDAAKVSFCFAVFF